MAGGTISATGMAVAQGFVSAGIMTAGMMLTNAIAPIRFGITGPTTRQTYKDSPTYSIGANQNQENKWGSVPVMLGRHKVYPPLGASSYTELVGSDEYLRMLLVWGYGPLKIEDLKIGDTALTSFDDVDIETREGWSTDTPLTLFPSSVSQTAIGAKLTKAGGRVVRTAEANVDELSVDVAFPRGLVQFDNAGNRTSRTVTLSIQYREVGSGTWASVPTTKPLSVSGTSLGPISLEEGTYSVYVSNPEAKIYIKSGTDSITGSYRIGEYTVSAVGGVTVTDLSPADCTGLVCSLETRFKWTGLETALRADFYIAVTGGTAGTVTTQTAEFIDNTTSVVRRGFNWKVDNTKQYEIGITRITADTDDDKIVDEVYWTYLRSIKTTYPISFPHNLAVTALRIKATDQLSGQLNNINGVISSYCPVWDDVAKEWGSDEADYEITNNPAALIRWVLTCNANARARTAAQIDDDTLGEFYEFCETNGYAFNMYRDFTASVFETCQDIAATARAAVTIKDGLWSVVADTGEQTLVQHITPRNSWGFSAEKRLYHRPHAFRIRFRNEDNDYNDDERIVYDDGYNSSNATLFESIEFPGITDPALIWKFGRFHIAQARLRPEMYTLYQDFEHLVCRRGDKVRVSHDIPLWGSGWGRVKSLVTDGGNITHVVLDELVTMEAGKSYACRFRLANGDTLILSVVTAVGTTATLELSTPVAEAFGPEAGDLAMFGEADRETVELLVHSIQRAGDFTAQLSLVDVATAVYDADSGVIPAFDPQTTKPVDVTTLVPNAPTIIGTEAGTAALDVSGGTVISRILVYLSSPSGTSRIRGYRARYRMKDETQWQYTPETEALTVTVSPVTDLVQYEVQVQAISIYGVPSLWTDTKTVFVVGQSADPENVAGFACNIVGTEAHLSWTANTDNDLSHYRIRWSPLLSGATWAASVDVVDKVGKPATSVTVPALVGTYLIKAVDYAGNESETAATAVTSIARITGMNYIKEVAQPTWAGTGDGTYYSATLGGIVLDSENDLYDVTDLYALGELYVNESLLEEGTYDLDETVDLDGVFTSRLSASLTISGDDLFSDLYDVYDLYELPDLYSAAEGSYSASLEVRTTKDDPDAAPVWGSWRRFIVGDYTARAFQFRIRLKGTQPSITPIVTAVSVEIDMPDRVIGFNATIPVGGGTVAFDPAFYVVPEIGLSVNDGQEGDKYTISAKDEAGFTIAFTNAGNGVERTISGIARAYGALET